LHDIIAKTFGNDTTTAWLCEPCGKSDEDCVCEENEVKIATYVNSLISQSILNLN